VKKGLKQVLLDLRIDVETEKPETKEVWEKKEHLKVELLERFRRGKEVGSQELRTFHVHWYMIVMHSIPEHNQLCTEKPRLFKPCLLHWLVTNGNTPLITSFSSHSNEPFFPPAQLHDQVGYWNKRVHYKSLFDKDETRTIKVQH
jgi:hypothetical protein